MQIKSNGSRDLPVLTEICVKHLQVNQEDKNRRELEQQISCVASTVPQKRGSMCDKGDASIKLYGSAAPCVCGNAKWYRFHVHVVSWMGWV